MRWGSVLLITSLFLLSQQSALLAEPLTSTIPLYANLLETPALTAAQVNTTTVRSELFPGRSAIRAGDEVTTTQAITLNTETSLNTENPPVASLSDVVSAVVQIEAVGTFVDPAEGLQLNAAGSGSGFIIDPSGIAVTNNHVVTGGGLYKVYVAGETEPRNAKVLAVSECSDLAVIDIQGDDFSYLAWYEGTIRVGLDVYAAGFPLGDPEYTLTRGIVSKARADGDTNWASVNKVIEHDATINPGNSGGPLVDKNGQVVAVNYAGNSETNQYFSISRDDALAVIEKLRAGENVDSIGINGEAFADDEGFSGIWVSSVKSGSPADQVGIQPGDILISMEGILLATDGTMASYCDILRSHEPDDTMAIQVLRFDTQEMLEGRLNGRALAPSFSFAEEKNGENAETDNQSTTDAASSGYSGYTTISDRSDILAMEVPVEWDDVADGDWVWQEETVGIQMVATTDLDTFYDSWGTPGALLHLSTTLIENNSPEDLLDLIDYSEICTDAVREPIPEGFYTGFYDIWSDCDNSANSAIIVSIVPETQDYIVFLEIYVASDADLEALDHILDSFEVKLPSAPNGNQTTLNEDIFDLVELSDLSYDYVLVNEAALSAILPENWADIASDDWVDEDDEVLGKTLNVAPDLQAFNDTWTTPGLYVRTATGLTEELDLNELLDTVDLSDLCTYDDRYEHSHTVYGVTYEGAYDLYSGCDGEENAFVYLIVQSDDLDQAVLIEFVVVDDADAEAFAVFLQTFYVRAATDSGSAVNDESDVSAEYTLISDDTETLTVRVPADWIDVSSSDWILGDETIGISLKAAINLEDYDTSWLAPGLFFGASTEFADVASEEILDVLDYAEECTISGRFEYDDSVFVGHYDLWEACGNTESLLVVLAAHPKESADYLVLLSVVLPQKDDTAALDEIFKTFNVGSSDAVIAEDAVPVAEVATRALNIRSGPGTSYERVGRASQGDQLLVLGQVDACDWLKIQTRDEVVGWVSGIERNVTVNVDCSAIPEVEAPPPAPQP